MLDVFRRGPVLPVVSIAAVSEAAPLARALRAGGINAIEVTLRTPAALGAITAIRQAVPDMLVGAGTVLTPEHLAAAQAAGAQFALSPGATPALLEAAAAAGVPFAPGVATATEAMTAVSYGFTALKFFPAAALGGADALKALAGPLPQLVFCPTGGVDAANAATFLALANVACVGGSWVAPEALIGAGDWAAISARAEAAARLRR